MSLTDDQVAALQVDDVVHLEQAQPEPAPVQAAALRPDADPPAVGWPGHEVVQAALSLAVDDEAPTSCDEYVLLAKAGTIALLTCAAKAHTIRLPNPALAGQLHLPADCPFA